MVCVVCLLLAQVNNLKIQCQTGEGKSVLIMCCTQSTVQCKAAARRKERQPVILSLQEAKLLLDTIT